MSQPRIQHESVIDRPPTAELDLYLLSRLIHRQWFFFCHPILICNSFDMKIFPQLFIYAIHHFIIFETISVTILHKKVNLEYF